MRIEELQANIDAQNEAGTYAKQLYAQLLPIFKPLVGTKILKANGSVIAKIKISLPEFPCNGRLHVYRFMSGYSLTWIVKACATFRGPGCWDSSIYRDASVTIGDLDGATLKDIKEAPDYRTDYTLEEIKDKWSKAEAAEKAYEAAKSACYPFTPCHIHG